MPPLWPPLQPLEDRGHLLVFCPDRPGIVAALSRFFFERGANIIDFDQHATETSGGVFFSRIAFELPKLSERLGELCEAFRPVAEQFGFEWQIVARRPGEAARGVRLEDRARALRAALAPPGRRSPRRTSRW